MPRTWFSRQPPVTRAVSVLVILLAELLLFGVVLGNRLAGVVAVGCGLVAWAITEWWLRRPRR